MNNNNKLDKVIDKLISIKDDMDIMKWEKFELDFSSPDLKNTAKEIHNKIGEKNGFYAIFDANRCLYIGIGRPIWKRIKSHYRAAQGLEKVLRWSLFFQENKKALTVYYKEFLLTDVTPRVEDKLKMLIEAVLEQKYRPKFEFNKD